MKQTLKATAVALGVLAAGIVATSALVFVVSALLLFPY